MAPNPKNQHAEAVVKRVSRKGHEDGHGGSWKVAFADFCLALMCLFMVLWVLAAREQEELQESLKESTASLLDGGQKRIPDQFGGPTGSLIPREPVPARGDDTTAAKRSVTSAANGDPMPDGVRLSKHRYETTADMQELAQVLVQLSERTGLAGNLQAVVTPYGLRLMLHDTDRQGMFKRGSSVPSDAFRQLLRDMGPLFAQIENQMLIVGHTDSLPYVGGNFGAFSNWTLSTNRALAARAQLMEGGMKGHSVLQVVGMAERAPLDRDDSTAGVNRRIELLVLTTAQAHTVISMFGLPDRIVPLADGVGAAVPDQSDLERLRAQLRGTPGDGRIR